MWLLMIGRYFTLSLLLPVIFPNKLHACTTKFYDPPDRFDSESFQY